MAQLSSASVNLSSNPNSPTTATPQTASLPATSTSSPQARNLAKIYKIIVVGDSNVGKTCLTYRFVTGRFPQKVDATVGVDFREKTVDLTSPDAAESSPRQLVRLQLWDSAGQERFRRSMVPHYYRNVHAAVFVYDVTNLPSFNSLAHWIEEYDKYCTAAGNSVMLVPRIIVGNKVDLDESRRQVPTYVAQQFADSHGMPLFETSALLDSRTDHVDAIFMTLAHKLVRQQPMNTSLNQGNTTIKLGGEGQSDNLHESATNDQSWCLC